MERWDVYDVHRARTGRTALRGVTDGKGGLGRGEYHLVVAACIFNRQGQMLIQQRHPSKQGFPGLWDVTTAGSALAGETSQQAMERELTEELGLTLDLSPHRPNFSINFDRGFEDFYLLEREVDLSALTLQPEEVQAVQWASLEDICSMIGNGSFIPYYESLIQLFFDSRERFGCHSVPS